MSFHSFRCHSIHSDVILFIPMSFHSFRCHFAHSDVIPFILMSSHQSKLILTLFHHSDVIPFILTSFHHSGVIPLILTSFHHSDVIPFILMSLQSFYIGMIERGENERDFRIKVRALDFFPGVLSTNEKPQFELSTNRKPPSPSADPLYCYCSCKEEGSRTRGRSDIWETFLFWLCLSW